MSVDEENEDYRAASPPCFLEDVNPAYSGLGDNAKASVVRWRRKERERLVSSRRALSPASWQRYSDNIMLRLKDVLGAAGGCVISFYWPIRGEPDLRPVMSEFAQGGAILALPVVAQKMAPLVFRVWAPGDPLERGVWNIPVPLVTANTVLPDIILAPVVGFDAACFRLGYGGGYFDRTLASLSHKPRVVGVGYEIAAMPSIYPQPHDIPMDRIITEERVLHRERALST